MVDHLVNINLNKRQVQRLNQYSDYIEGSPQKAPYLFNYLGSLKSNKQLQKAYYLEAPLTFLSLSKLKENIENVTKNKSFRESYSISQKLVGGSAIVCIIGGSYYCFFIKDEIKSPKKKIKNPTKGGIERGCNLNSV